jgi:hypothetical protein
MMAIRKISTDILGYASWFQPEDKGEHQHTKTTGKADTDTAQARTQKYKNLYDLVGLSVHQKFGQFKRFFHPDAS